MTNSTGTATEALGRHCPTFSSLVAAHLESNTSYYKDSNESFPCDGKHSCLLEYLSIWLLPVYCILKSVPQATRISRMLLLALCSMQYSHQCVEPYQNRRVPILKAKNFVFCVSRHSCIGTYNTNPLL